MDVRSGDDWSKGARQVAVLDLRQQSPGQMGRGGEQHPEESRYEPGLMLVDSGSDPRAWLALMQPPGTCAAHATASDYLQHSPSPSTGSYQGKSQQPASASHFTTTFVTRATGSWSFTQVTESADYTLILH